MVRDYLLLGLGQGQVLAKGFDRAAEREDLGAAGRDLAPGRAEEALELVLGVLGQEGLELVGGGGLGGGGVACMLVVAAGLGGGAGTGGGGMVGTVTAVRRRLLLRRGGVIGRGLCGKEGGRE